MLPCLTLPFAPQVLSGNNDSSTPVTNTLGLPFAARQVYLYPTHWTGQAPSLRWELLGCVEGGHGNLVVLQPWKVGMGTWLCYN